MPRFHSCASEISSAESMIDQGWAHLFEKDAILSFFTRDNKEVCVPYMARNMRGKGIGKEFLEEQTRTSRGWNSGNSSQICEHNTSKCVKVSMYSSIPMVNGMKKNCQAFASSEPRCLEIDYTNGSFFYSAIYAVPCPINESTS